MNLFYKKMKIAILSLALGGILVGGLNAILFTPERPGAQQQPVRHPLRSRLFNTFERPHIPNDRGFVFGAANPNPEFRNFLDNWVRVNMSYLFNRVFSQGIWNKTKVLTLVLLLGVVYYNDGINGAALVDFVNHNLRYLILNVLNWGVV